jgi:hypothetical protein
VYRNGSFIVTSDSKLDSIKIFSNICNKKQPSVSLATWQHSRLISVHTDLCTFCLIRNARNSLMDISNGYETLCLLIKCVQILKPMINSISNVHVCQTCARVPVGPNKKKLSTSGSPEYSWIKFMLFHTILVGTIETVCCGQFDIVYLSPLSVSFIYLTK